MELIKERFTLSKEERLCSRKALEELFEGSNKSILSYPIRAVFQKTEETGIRIMISVSKRFFKRAVKRNRIKRQLREAYRLNKHLLRPANGGINISFLWNSNDILSTAKVMEKMQILLNKVNESISDTSSAD
ncbi:MAG: ribonuclease P protein component [Bacteroidaceae bacterium]|nr:ribonuclease P protein component [Bacteroidaceae bacterium]